jgi:hypothetical protein
LRREPSSTEERSSRPASRIERIPGRWLATILIAGTALLITATTLPSPRGASYATASHATVSLASVTSPASGGCRGVTPAIFPAQGFIANPARTQGGHLWWRRSDGGVCLGTVVEWVRYNTTTTKTWRVIVYTAQHPQGQSVAHRTFTLPRGWYFWGFSVHQVFQGLTAVCLTATDAFGAACVDFSQ